MAWYWIFAIYGLLLFVGCYIVTEVGQNYYYDEVTPFVALKVGGTTLALAAALTWWNPLMVNMLTTELGRTALLAIAGFVLFTLVIRFHPPHAAILGPITIVLVSLVSALAVESLANTGRANVRERPRPPQVLRKSAGGSFGPSAVEEPEVEPPEAEPASP